MLAAINTRRQLTLFVREPESPRLEALRRLLDPIQASLIAAHVTLCREDEIDGLSPASVFQRVQSWAGGPLSLSFGPPLRFGGYGALLPCVDGLPQFQRLRGWLLQRAGVREHGAHITLAHPRNRRSSGNADAALSACPVGLQLQFASVALIEQQGSAPWRLLQASTLGTGTQRAALYLPTDRSEK